MAALHLCFERSQTADINFSELFFEILIIFFFINNDIANDHLLHI